MNNQIETDPVKEAEGERNNSWNESMKANPKKNSDYVCSISTWGIHGDSKQCEITLVCDLHARSYTLSSDLHTHTMWRGKE